MQNKQQEYLKQRERLKYVTQNHVGKKILDPDIMIEQLISDKETFKFNLETQLPYVLPKWLQVQNNLAPAVYEQVWQAVKLGPTFQYCDTQIITQLFTTSGLSLERLGHLWSLTNVSSPGFLTQQELYVMLALIALVQTGYNVKDISIIRNINHPILPQMDYGFLNITVANPAINRNITKSVSHDPKMTNTIVYNGIGNALISNSVPLQVKPINHFPDTPKPLTKDSSMNCDLSSAFESSCSLNTFALNSQSSSIPNFKSPPIIRIPEMRKSDMDVTFAIPETRKSELNSNLSISNFDEQTPELDVDFPISNIRITNTSLVAERKTEPLSVFKENGLPPVLQKPPNEVKRFDFLNVNNLSNSIEPRSLDLPVFGNENSSVVEEDEFTEFQSATVVSNTDEYDDFQSASPIVKYELDNFMSDKNVLKSSETTSWDSTVERKSSMTEEAPEYKSSSEADKYDVFRSLVEHEEEKKPKIEDEEENEEEEEFGEFYAADVKPSQEKSNLSIKDKCLEACLRLLNEGLSIFSSISKEETLREVLSDERGCRYFNQLKIVYETSQRFQRQFESTHLNDTLQSTWAKLSSYTKYIANDDLLDDMYAEEDVDASLCKLCETKCDLNCVRYAGNYYHVTCINLFLHFVEDSEISTMLNL